jgi:hypothetical protein
MFSMAWATEIWGLAGMDPFDETRDLLGDHIGFEIDTATGAKLTEESDFEGVWNQQHLERRAVDLVDGQADAEGTRMRTKDACARTIADLLPWDSQRNPGA